jgi:hypothetical protein
MTERIARINDCTQRVACHGLLAELWEEIVSEGSTGHSRQLVSLLYHPLPLVRFEAQILIAYLQVPLTAAERATMRIWQPDGRGIDGNSLGADERELIVQGLLFGNRAKQQILLQRTRQLQTIERDIHLARLWARRQWAALLACSGDEPAALQRILKQILKHHQQPYMQRRAAELLHLLGCEVAANVPKAGARRHAARSADKQETAAQPLPDDDENCDDPLQRFLRQLRRRGLNTQQGRIYPRIDVATVTGRVVYRQPPVQTWSAKQRSINLRPATGCILFSYDFVAIEPMLLGNALVGGGYLPRSAWPDGDIYAAIHSHRAAAKKWLLRLIYGHSQPLPETTAAFLKPFIAAFAHWRDDFCTAARSRGTICTIDGRHIPLPEDAGCQPGRMVNYYFQGSAADVFHRMVISLDNGFRAAAMRANIILLIYDAFCLEVASDSLEEVLPFVDDIRAHVNAHYGFSLPLQLRLQGG